MTIFRFLKANRQAQLDWIRENPKTYLAFNAVALVAILGPMMLDSHMTERAQRKFYADKTENEQ